MNSVMIWQTISTGREDTLRLAELLASNLAGGEVIELTADLGGGKTTFTQGLAKGLGSEDIVSSPTFTLSKVYKARSGLEIHHFDFYRLSEPGVIADQLAESINEGTVVTVVEWSDIVKNVLPPNRLSIELRPTASNEDERTVTFKYSAGYAPIIKKVQTQYEDVQP